MEKEEFRAVIKHFHLNKWTVAQIKAEFHEVHEDTASFTLALRTFYFWIDEFKRDRTSTKDEACPGRPVEATASAIIDKIHHIVMEDRRMKVREIAEIVGISVGVMHNILREKL